MQNNKKRILVIDDEKVVLDSCSHLFKELDYTVEVASSGVEGIRKASQGDFDVIITDYQMKGIDGLEVTDCIKKEQPKSPIIMITGHSTDDLEIKATKSGVFDYIKKPFTPDEINTAVKKAVDWHEMTAKEDQKNFLSNLLKKMDTVSKGVGSNPPAAICNSITRSVGVVKAKMTAINLTILGIFAGAYIGFGAALATLVSHDAAKVLGLGLAKLFTGVVFSVGLMLVVIAGAELFTGNNLMIAATADRKITVSNLLKKWGIVYVANFIGSILLVAIMYYSNLWQTGNLAVGVKAIAIANSKVNLTFAEAFVRGIGCNWLVCLAVWMASSSPQTSGKILAIIFPIAAFVALGFEHCVANMYFIPLGLFLKGTVAAANLGFSIENLTWLNFITKNLIPVTLGNIIGGSFFVGLLYWFVYLKSQKESAG